MRRRHVLILGFVGSIALAILAIVRMNGLSTREQPTFIERAVARTARRLTVPPSARAAVNPVTFSPEVWAEARAHFADHCATCHANDGSGMTEIGQNLYPKAPDMRLPATQDLTDGELYWVIENGVRLTGMPAWGAGDGNDMDTWKQVHFIRRLKELAPDQLKEMEGMNPRSPAEIREEIEDQRFLAGEPIDSPPAHEMQH
jgi:mono/diheme cytochrome c family protein